MRRNNPAGRLPEPPNPIADDGDETHFCRTCAFSGIVAGNVKEEGVQAIEKNGPFDIDGDADIMRALDKLLQAFVAQHRMKLPGGSAYEPCYRVLGA